MAGGARAPESSSRAPITASLHRALGLPGYLNLLTDASPTSRVRQSWTHGDPAVRSSSRASSVP